MIVYCVVDTKLPLAEQLEAVRQRGGSQTPIESWYKFFRFINFQAKDQNELEAKIAKYESIGFRPRMFKIVIEPVECEWCTKDATGTFNDRCGCDVCIKAYKQIVQEMNKAGLK